MKTKKTGKDEMPCRSEGLLLSSSARAILHPDAPVKPTAGGGSGHPQEGLPACSPGGNLATGALPSQWPAAIRASERSQAPCPQPAKRLLLAEYAGA